MNLSLVCIKINKPSLGTWNSRHAKPSKRVYMGTQLYQNQIPWFLRKMSLHHQRSRRTSSPVTQHLSQAHSAGYTIHRYWFVLPSHGWWSSSRALDQVTGRYLVSLLPITPPLVFSQRNWHCCSERLRFLLWERTNWVLWPPEFGKVGKG